MGKIYDFSTLEQVLHRPIITTVEEDTSGTYFALLLLLQRKIIPDFMQERFKGYIQGGSNMTGTDLCVNKPHCAAAVRP